MVRLSLEAGGPSVRIRKIHKFQGTRRVNYSSGHFENFQNTPAKHEFGEFHKHFPPSDLSVETKSKSHLYTHHWETGIGSLHRRKNGRGSRDVEGETESRGTSY